MTPIWVIMGANFLVMVAYAINPGAVVSNFGLRPDMLGEQPWTLVTSMFVHAGIWHILMNMLMLYFFGQYVLGLLGENRFLFIYFAGGLAGSLLYVLVGPDNPVVGASGALYAVMGTLAVMRPRIKVLVFFMIPVDLWLLVVVGAVMIRPPGVAWQAHLGGLALGLATGFYFRKKERGSYWR